MMKNQNTTTKIEQIIEEKDGFSLEIEDLELADIIDARINSAETHWMSLDIDERREKLLSYLVGEQLEEKELHTVQTKHIENVFWEAYVRNRSILMSRIPDIIVKEGKSDDEDAAKLLTEIANNDIAKEKNAQTLAIAALSRPFNFFGVIKVIWDKVNKNYKFIPLNPANIVLDNTVVDPDDARFIGEYVDTTLEEIIMRFPKKADEFLSYIGTEKKFEGDWKKSRKKMATPIKILEVWFKEYVKETNPETGEENYKQITAVVWKYKDVILGKMKHPFWDYNGTTRYFKMEEEEKKELTQEEIMKIVFDDENDENVISQKYYANYLKSPEFPYYIMRLNNTDSCLIDITTDYEQIIGHQDSINRQGIQIDEMNARTVGVHVFSADALEKSDIENLDPRNFNEAIVVPGRELGKVHTHIKYDPAPAQLYNSQGRTRSIAFEMVSLNPTTRGVRESGDETLGARQMMREQDFGVLDYEVTRTINPAAQWMARWMLQMIKRFYRTPQYRDHLGGEDGKRLQIAITQDLVQDGMIVEVSASSVDKMQKKRMAITNAEAGMTDPLTYFEDTDQSDPKERAKRVLIFKSSPELYAQQYLGGLGNPEEMVNQLNQMSPPDQMSAVGQAPEQAPPQAAPQAVQPQPA